MKLKPERSEESLLFPKSLSKGKIPTIMTLSVLLDSSQECSAPVLESMCSLFKVVIPRTRKRASAFFGLRGGPRDLVLGTVNMPVLYSKHG